jgi:hypothetical protein
VRVLIYQKQDGGEDTNMYTKVVLILLSEFNTAVKIDMLDIKAAIERTWSTKLGCFNIAVHG